MAEHKPLMIPGIITACPKSLFGFFYTGERSLPTKRFSFIGGPTFFMNESLFMFRFLFISLLCMWHVACTEASVPPPEPPETQTLVTQLDAGVLSVDAPADSGWVFNPENDAGIKLDAGLSSEDTVDAGIVSVLRPDSGQSVEEEENNGSAVDTQDAGVMTISPVDSGTQTTTFYDDAGTPWSPDSGDDEDTYHPNDSDETPIRDDENTHSDDDDVDNGEEAGANDVESIPSFAATPLWSLTFQDEFNGPQPEDDLSCYSRTPKCLFHNAWGPIDCPDQVTAQMTDLNKCVWSVYDFYNYMNGFDEASAKKNAFSASEVKVENGNLVLSARTQGSSHDDCGEWYDDERTNGYGNYTVDCPLLSGGVHSRHYSWAGNVSVEGFLQKHGRFEVRARLPGGPGAWPAFGCCLKAVVGRMAVKSILWKPGPIGAGKFTIITTTGLKRRASKHQQVLSIRPGHGFTRSQVGMIPLMIIFTCTRWNGMRMN